ncbi:hypothetical protein F2P56_006051, partial [Juglans regia]
GEAPAFIIDDLQTGFLNGFDLKSQGCATATVIGNKAYLIGGVNDEPTLSLGVHIFDQTRGELVSPLVLGTKPTPCKGHSAVLLNEDRILMIKRGSVPDDCIWFLEVGILHIWVYIGANLETIKLKSFCLRCILDIDVQGARSVKASSLDAMFIFVCPPSMEELEKRLRARGTETEEQVQKRLRNAQTEIEQGKSSGIFDHILYNDNLEECYESLKKLLGLDGNITTSPKASPKGVEFPMDLAISKIDQKIIIKCGSPDLKTTSNLIVLDLSSLKGGAPGRTRGLDFYAIESFSNGLNGFNQLS